MINIRLVLDLRNKYPEIEELVWKEDEAVYLNIINELEIYRAIEEKIEKREEPIRIWTI